MHPDVVDPELGTLAHGLFGELRAGADHHRINAARDRAQNVFNTENATERPRGLYFVFELLWRGVGYGLIDTLLLTVVPCLVAWRLLHGQIGGVKGKLRFAGLALPLVIVVELADTSRFVLDRIEPDPGFGMVTIYVHQARDPEAPNAIVIPIGTIRRIELRSAPDERVAQFGFVVPTPDS
jgi:hypothetical protein